MPEGDTLYRTAAALRPHLVGRRVIAASARRPGPQVERLVDRTIEAVESKGKNLLIRFDSGLELRTHLGMHGAWHRYAPGERWRHPPVRARLVLEVPGAVAVCFDAPAVELFETRAEGLHPVLRGLGPDLLDDAFGEPAVAEAIRRLRAPARAATTIAEALLDQRALAGIGNVYKSETLFLERVDPFAAVAELDTPALERLVGTARRLLLANRDGGPRVTTSEANGTADRRRRGDGLWVYGRAARPCRRCGTPVASRVHGHAGRRTYWCPSCQPSPPEPRTAREAGPGTQGAGNAASRKGVP